MNETHMKIAPSLETHPSQASRALWRPKLSLYRVPLLSHCRLSLDERFEGTNVLRKVNMNDIRFQMKSYNNYQSGWMQGLRGLRRQPVALKPVVDKS